VQEVLLVLLQKLPEFRYDQQQSFRGWLRAVLLNRWRDQRRAALPAAGPDDPPLVALAGPDAAADLEEADYHRYLVRRALELMKSEFQETTWRACWETVANSRSPAETAALLGLSVPAVYMARCRVLARLRDELAGLVD
jgi:RNA polymerase sigma-70 factor (ECF subfamily)